MPRTGREYHIDNEQFFMLTYPTTPNGWPVDDLVSLLERLGCDYRIGHELHQDGKPHFHAMVVFDDPYDDRAARATFTIGGRAPSFRMRRANPAGGWDYVGKHAGTKDGHYIVAEKGTRPGGEDAGVSRSTNDVWHEIILARTETEFFELAARLAPKQLACSFTQLKGYAAWKYKTADEMYSNPIGEWSVPFELQDWARENIGMQAGR